MTSDEHLLMTAMFTRQAKQIKVLSEVLKSNGILQGDDLEAFTAIARADTWSDAMSSIETWNEYTATCKALKISY